MLRMYSRFYYYKNGDKLTKVINNLFLKNIHKNEIVVHTLEEKKC